MAEHKSVRLEKQQLQGISEMVDAGVADNDSEALRNALNAGLTEFGVLNGGHYDTRLRQTARRFGDALGLLAVFLVGWTLVYPVGWRLIIAAPLAASLGCYAFDRVLAAHEPGVSKRLGGLLRGEKA